MKFSVSGLSLSLNGIKILDDISFDVSEQSFVCIVGPNGSGKSSLLRVLANEIIKYDGKVTSLNESQFCYLPQNLPSPNFLNVYEMVMLGFYARDLEKSEKQRYTMELLDLCGVYGLADSIFADISEGEKQRTLLAFCLAQSKDLILLDEPLSAVDLSGRQKFFELLKSISNMGNTLVVVTHDIDMAIKHCNKIIGIKDGRKVFDDAPDKFKIADILF